MNQAQNNKFRQLGATPVERAWRKFLEINRSLRLGDFIGAFIFCGVVLFMIWQESGEPDVPRFQEGQVASRTVRLRKAIDVIDREATEAEKLQIISRIPDVYDYDMAMGSVWADRWKMAIRYLRAQRLNEKKLESRAATFANKAGINVEVSEYKILESLGFSMDLEKSIMFALAPLWEQKIIDKKIPLTYTIEVVDLKSSKSEMLRPSDMGRLLSIEEAAALVGRSGRYARSPYIKTRDLQRLPWSHWRTNQKAVVFALQSRLVQANVTMNRKETEVRREAGLKTFRPLIQKLAKGEVIVREGERVSRKAAQLMNELSKNISKDHASTHLIFQTLYAAFSLWLLLQFLRRQYPKLLESSKNTIVAAAWLIMSLACFKLTLIFLLEILSDQFPAVPASFFLFLVPVSCPAMVLRLLLNPAYTIAFTLIYSVASGLLLEKAAHFGFFILVSCLLGSLFIAQCKTRSSLYKAGLQTAVICAIMAVLLMAAWRWQLPLSNIPVRESDGVENFILVAAWSFLGGLIGGWLSSAMTLVMTPILENLLDYTTDLKLLELARMDHPLLRDLVLKAPGTYHHSIIVGSLVEAGAEAIGANALLARVGSYYHDIGKIGRAEYFIENQSRGHNPHDQTRPQLSAKIIISHVKEGRLLAEAHKLGQNMIDFIEQHHGTSLVSYFYNKAQQEAAQPGSSIAPDEVHEEDYRYPGPKPQSKENAILALADSCEAATRSLIDPTPARIEGMVRKIMNKALGEGLLDEADITMREIHLVAGAFIRILLGIHHNRIQYPDQEKGLPQNTLPLVKNVR